MWAQVWGSSWFWKFCLEVFVLKFCFEYRRLLCTTYFNHDTFAIQSNYFSRTSSHHKGTRLCSVLVQQTVEFTLNTTLKECCEVYIKCRLKYCLYFGGKPVFGGIWVLRNYRFSLKCCTEGTTGHIRTNIYLIKALRQQIKQQTDSYQYKNITCSNKTNNLL